MAIPMAISMKVWSTLFLSEISIDSIYQWFSNDLKSKPKRAANFVINYLWNCNSQREEKQQTTILRKFFPFSIFWNYCKFGNGFYTVFNTCFWTVNNFKVTLFTYKLHLYQNWTHHKTGLKRAVVMPSYQIHYLTCIERYINFYCPELWGSWVMKTQKNPIWRVEARYYLEYVFNSSNLTT